MTTQTAPAVAGHVYGTGAHSMVVLFAMNGSGPEAAGGQT